MKNLRPGIKKLCFLGVIVHFSLYSSPRVGEHICEMSAEFVLYVVTKLQNLESQIVI